MKYHFHVKGWAPRLTLRKTLNVFQKWLMSYSTPMGVAISFNNYNTKKVKIKNRGLLIFGRVAVPAWRVSFVFTAWSP